MMVHNLQNYFAGFVCVGLLTLAAANNPATAAQAKSEFNVRTYGAKGDGTTDDTAAIQAALDAAAKAGGGTVDVPEGTYPINIRKPLRMKSNITLSGEGGSKSKLISNINYDGTPNTIGSILIIGIGGTGEVTNDVSVKGMWFGYSKPESIRGKGEAVVRFSRCRHASFTDNTIQYGQAGLNINRVEGMDITGNTVGGTKIDGIILDNGSDEMVDLTCKDIRITKNKVTNTHDDAISLISRFSGGKPARKIAQNIYIGDNTTDTQLEHGGGVGIYGVKGCIVENNKVRNPASHGISVMMYVNQSGFHSEDVIVRGNTINSDQPLEKGKVLPSAFYVGERAAKPTGKEEQSASITNIVFENNVVNINDRNGFFCELGEKRGSDPNLWPTDIKIINNELHFTNPDCPADLAGARFSEIKNLTFENNKITGFPGSGLVITNHKNTKINNNTFDDCVSNANLSDKSIVQIGKDTDRNDKLDAFQDNVINKTKGSANSAVLIYNSQKTSYQYKGNVFSTNGSRMLKGKEVFIKQSTDN